ncbi:ATP-binding cassette subfamily B protein [Melghiribacillus thermohalophilus]|uniref:ATP-binding cassette subfamily B protein n=1 Tax=Melghiribacillus thermohalophilus TaxID=1324956 RepID=A0A4R3MR91_9BACI|nr:ABC transporter ATP-binding protein [Melghiribacillus thermohalophilus]TCT18010.1 ATP-binding cassette subfamily B protein [Melghiribacillus thermohalophilus]
MKPSTEKRLVQYAMRNKKMIFFGLFCLLLAVALELTGPFIAKRLIDEHIVGIENHWMEVQDDDNQTVEYQGRLFKRADRLSEQDEVIRKVTLLQAERSYYLIEEEVPLTGNRSLNNEGAVVIQTPEQTWTVAGEKLTLGALYRFFSPEVQPIIWLLVLYMGLIVIASVFQYLKTYLLQVSSNRIIKQMRDDVFGHIQRLPISYFVNRPAGKIVARVTNDTEAIRELYVKVLETFASGMIYMSGIFFALFLLDIRLAAVTLLVIPIMVIWMKWYKVYAGKFNRVIRSTVSDINGFINEAIQGMPIIQAFRRTKSIEDEFETLNHRHYTYQIKMNTLNALTSFNLVNVIRNLAFVAFIWYFGGMSLNGTGIVSVGVLYAFVDYLTRLFEPMNQMISQLPQLEQARVAGSRVFELMDQEGEEVKDESISRYKGEVVFDHVWFAYEEDDYVLKDMSFKIEPGQTAAFVGHTGSGKSSVMNLLFRFYDPQKGKIMIDGMDTKSLSRQQVRKHIGIVLQDPFIFTGTIISNVTMNDPSITREQAIAALKAVGADSFIEKLPNQYDEPVKEKGSEFSAGQRQLISFARALAFDPAILILDEATASIDTETEGLIQEALKILTKGRTTLVIAHRLSTIQQADQIFVLERGKIIEKGTHDQLIQQQGNYYQMYKMQQGQLKNQAVV